MLAEHPTAIGSDGKLPLVLYQFVGAGKAMFHAFDDTWRWRFRAGDKYFGRFWVQTIRFLARSKLVGQRQAEVQTDRRRYQRGQPIQFRVRFPNPGLAPTSGDVTVQVERSGQGPAQADAQARARARGMCSKARCRRPPKASTRSGSCPRPSSRARSPRPASASMPRSTSSNASK